MRQMKTSSLEWGVGCLGALLGVLMLIVPHQFGGGLTLAPALAGTLLAGGALLLAVAVVAVGPALRVAAHLLAGAGFLALAAGYAKGGAWTAALLHGVLGAGTVVALLSSARAGAAGGAGRDLLVVLVALIALGDGVAMLIAPGPWAPIQAAETAGALSGYGAAFVIAGGLLLAVQFRAAVPWRARLAAHGLAAGAFLVFVVRAAAPARSLTAVVCFGGLAAALLFLAWRQPRPLAVDPASLATRLGLAFAMVAAMPLLAAVALVSQQQERAATTEALDVQRALAVAVAGNVADHVERYRAAVAALAGQTALRTMRAEVHRPVLLAFQAAHPDGLLSTYDAQGRGVARGDDLAVLDIDQAGIFQDVRRTDEPSMQITVGRLVERPVFVFAAPIRDAGGRFAGVAVVALESARMADVLEQAAWQSGSRAYLVDASGRLIAHPRAGAVGSDADLAGRRPVEMLLERPDPSGAIEYGGKGVEQLAGYARVPRLGWGVVVERPSTVALASTHQAREMALLFLLGGVVLAVGAGVLAAKRLTRPLDALGRAVEGFAAGRPDAPPPPTRVTEVARLTSVFEGMRATLEARTAERERAGAALRRAHAELEAALRRTDEQLRFALESGRVGIWDWNVRTGELRWSDNLTPMHGLPPGSSPGTVDAFRALIHGADQARVEAAVERTLHHGEPYDVEFRIVWPDGTVRWVAAKGQAFTDETAAPVRMVGVTIDVTERKRAEETLRESEARYRGLLEHSIQGVCIHRGFEIRYANPALARIFGYDGPEDLVGRDLRTLFAPRRQRAQASGAGPGPEESDPSRYEAQGLRRDGTPIWIEAMTSPVSWEGGPGVLTTLVDITERRRAEEHRARLLAGEQAARAEAEAANRAKDEFLATLSHELRTPLNAMLGWAQLLRTGRLDAAAVRRAVDVIERNTKMQAQLIEDLLDVSRIITGKLNLALRPVSLAAVIDAALDAVRGAAEAKDIELRTIGATAVPPIEGDADRLQQVVWNLLSNAIKFTPRGGRVDVTLEAREATVVLRVQDTGKGIPAHFLPFIFDRFRQADSTSTRAHGGLGLGLAIVRHLVALHGGTVQARSDGENRGTTFSVELPILGAAAEEGAVPRPVGTLTASGDGDGLPALDGTQVLVVDDEPDARDVLVALFAQCGAVVAAVGSAADALRAVADHRPDVLVSDVAMPGVDGYDLIREVRALPPERGGRVPAVALTAYARSEDRDRALAAGFHAHVPKPVEPARLARLVARLAGRPPAAHDGD
jgi:PAS domain S-box-containing protein